ncbi:alanine racemase [bacterium]|nr:alanine racemase [bacterium]
MSIQINSSAILHNISTLFKDNKNNKIGLFLKDNAYNLNIHNIALIAEDINSMLAYIACNKLEDLIILRNNGYRGACVYYGWDLDVKLLSQYNILPTIKSVEELNILLDMDYSQSAILVFDSGLKREGLDLLNSESYLARLYESRINIVSIWSQYINRLNPYASENIATQKELLGIKSRYFPKASVSLETSSTFEKNYQNRVGIPRVGQLIFGLWKDSIRIKNLGLVCSISIEFDIYQLKKVSKHDKIGYSPRTKLTSDGYIGISNLGFDNFLKLPSDFILEVQSNIGKAKLIGPNFMSFGYILFDKITKYKSNLKNICFYEPCIEGNIISKLATELNTSEFELISRINCSTQ